MGSDPELLVGVSDDELEALADSLLAPSAQTRSDRDRDWVESTAPKSRKASETPAAPY